MVKTFMICCCLLFAVKDVFGQSTWWKEWFQQKSTQREYLINQIAALQVYIGYAKKGYEIYNKGLTTIGSFKNGEFTLHSDYFLSLKGINPEIAKYARVTDIVQLQVQTVKSYNRTMKTVRDGGNFRAEEINFLIRVYGRLLTDCSLLADELITLTTANKLDMDDDQRLQRIDKLYMEMQDKYRFAETFGNEAMMLGHSRAKALREIEFGKRINNLKTD